MPRSSWLLDAYPINLVVVDLNLGAEPGLQLVTRLGLDFPVVVISDDRTCETDKVRGLECGADDYMSKPFGKQGVRRPHSSLSTSGEGRGVAGADARVFIRGLVLEHKIQILRHVSGEEVKLSAAEFSVLLTFLDNPQTILSREEIIAKTRLHDHEVVDRSIDVLILRLRRKIETGSDGAAMIQTVRGKGYVFVAPIRT